MGKAKFGSVNELKEKVEGYFEECEAARRPPTVHGLALGLGFATREAMLRYRGKPQMREEIRRAITRLGQYAEEQLLKTGSGARYAPALGLNAAGDEDAAEDVMAEVHARLERRGGA